jgi:hypothetical protein
MKIIFLNPRLKASVPVNNIRIKSNYVGTALVAVRCADRDKPCPYGRTEI